jgi:hypothetical protein
VKRKRRNRERRRKTVIPEEIDRHTGAQLWRWVHGEGLHIFQRHSVQYILLLTTEIDDTLMKNSITTVDIKGLE